MEIEDVQNLDVNRIVKIVGREVLSDALLNAIDQGKSKSKLCELFKHSPAAFINNAFTWEHAKYQRNFTGANISAYWQGQHEKVYYGFKKAEYQPADGEEPQWLFGEIFKEEEERIKKRKQIKAWN